jgi:hypothetical protein
MHHRLPGQSYQNATSAKVVDAANALQHDERVPQSQVNAALLAPRIGCVAAS